MFGRPDDCDSFMCEDRSPYGCPFRISQIVQGKRREKTMKIYLQDEDKDTEIDDLLDDEDDEEDEDPAFVKSDDEDDEDEEVDEVG